MISAGITTGNSTMEDLLQLAMEKVHSMSKKPMGIEECLTTCEKVIGLLLNVVSMKVMAQNEVSNS